MDDDNNQLFVGIKISSKLKRELDSCAPAAECYYKGDSPESLQVVTIGGESVIGRFIRNGYPVTEIDNVSRNIRSIITLITGGSRIEEDSVRIYADPPNRISFGTP